MTQTSRLIEYVRTHPGCSGLEIIQALALPKYTSRISDARALGVEIECITRPDKRRGFRLVERPVQQTLAL